MSIRIRSKPQSLFLSSFLEFVQEPCIIAMLRVRADCGIIPSEVIDTISVIAQSARRSTQMVCLEAVLTVVF